MAQEKNAGILKQGILPEIKDNTQNPCHSEGRTEEICQWTARRGKKDKDGPWDFWLKQQEIAFLKSKPPNNYDFSDII